MNIVIFASDSKGVSSVVNIVKKLSKSSHNYFFLYSEETQLQYPTMSMDKFTYDSNVSEEDWEGVWSNSLAVPLPFTPDVLLIQRSCWQPEQSIIDEFKKKWNAKIAMVEVNTHLINNPETVLEMHSRTKYPQNQVDLYFDQSEYTKKQRGLSGFNTSKSVVTGNPKYDHLLDIVYDRQKLYEKYDLSQDKTQIMFYSLINTSRNEMLDTLKTLMANLDHSKYEVLFKPYPGEPYNEKFKHQFFPFIIDNVKVVYDDSDIYPLSHICDIHIGAVSSIMHFPLLLNKKIININNKCTYLNSISSLQRFLDETNIGVEDSVQFWMRVHNISKQKFLDMLNEDRLLTFQANVSKFMTIVDNCTISFDDELSCLSEEARDASELLSLFDQYNDFNASERIVNELEKYIEES